MEDIIWSHRIVIGHESSASGGGCVVGVEPRAWDRCHPHGSEAKYVVERETVINPKSQRRDT